MPSEKATALVRSATALPHATGHASSSLSSGGARCRDLATMDSSAAEARFNGSLQYQNWFQKASITEKPGRIIVASGNATGTPLARVCDRSLCWLGCLASRRLLALFLQLSQVRRRIQTSAAALRSTI